MNFYFEASKVLDRLDAKQGSIKGILATVAEKDRKRTSALVIETLKYKAVLKDVISQSKILKEERKIQSFNLALVLVHDLLLSDGIQAGDGPIKQAVLRHKTRLRSEFQRIKIKRGARHDAELAQTGDSRAALIPRYVRVNKNLWTTQEALAYFLDKGFQLCDPLLSSKGLKQDEHISDLLVFSPQARLQDDPTYKSGKIILQDKASCFPAIVLARDINQGSVVIDATAAPGNKTSHLSALMDNKGKLYAFERDRNRFSTLTSMLSKAGCRNTEPLNIDFLSVPHDDPKYSQVTHILLDPSCSGSGIVNRLDHLLEQDIDEKETLTPQKDRLTKLASFQVMMIKHAMKFPAVTRIVYSTCSVHPIENEHVVNQALASAEAQARRFKLAPQDQVIPIWHRRGLPKELDPAVDASSLIRCQPGDDATNGFFVSCFVRTQQESHIDEYGDSPRLADRQKRKRANKEDEAAQEWKETGDSHNLLMRLQVQPKKQKRK